MDGDLSVNKLLFLNKERYGDKSSAHLISSGPWGMIHFWSVFQGAELLSRFRVVCYLIDKIHFDIISIKNQFESRVKKKARMFLRCALMQNVLDYLQQIIKVLFAIGTLKTMLLLSRNSILQTVI